MVHRWPTIGVRPLVKWRAVFSWSACTAESFAHSLVPAAFSRTPPQPQPQWSAQARRQRDRLSDSEPSMRASNSPTAALPCLLLSFPIRQSLVWDQLMRLSDAAVSPLSARVCWWHHSFIHSLTTRLLTINYIKWSVCSSTAEPLLLLVQAKSHTLYYCTTIPLLYLYTVI